MTWLERLRGVVLFFCAACNSGPDVAYTSTGLPYQCGATCTSSQICDLGTVRFGMCTAPGPMICDGGADGGTSGCPSLCVHAGNCVALPSGCSAADCECIVKTKCLEENNNGQRCGGYCDVDGGSAQVICLSCS